MITDTRSHMIRHIVEPKRLLLAWQPLEERKDRTRRIVGELVRKDDDVIFHYFKDSEDLRKARENGFHGFPAFPKFEKEYSADVLETFMLRLPPRTRSDYRNFLKAIRIPEDAAISDFALLGYSEARLPGDGYSIIHPFDDNPVPCEFLSEIAGFRYYKDSISDLEFGAALHFEFEKDNPVDPNAIRILLGKQKIGYVNRGQLKAFAYWLTHNKVRAYVERKNGRPDKLRVLMFVEIY
jgi:hypothetical protein